MIARCGVTAERHHVDCWSVSSPAAQILPASSKVYHMNFVPLLLVHLCNTACYVDDAALWRHSRDSMLTAGLSSPAAPNLASIIKECIT
jgi:hypothetical protein